MNSRRCWRGGALPALRASLLWLLLAAPAAPAAHAQADENDPLEPFNRAVFAFNHTLDGLILEPAAIMYRAATPRLARDGVTNFLNNLRTPVILANDLLQGEWQRAEHTLGRFMLNTILGFGGLIDVGTHVGMPERHDEDFGQTLAKYGVGSGPYLMVPLLGPSNPRDLTGRVVDFLFDPLFFVAPTDVSLARFGASTVDFRERNLDTINELERSSLDLYAATRTLVRQLRASEIRNGAPAPIEDIYNEDLYTLDEDVGDDLADPDDPYRDPEGDPYQDPEDDDAQ